MSKLNDYRKAIAKHGLLAHATTPSPDTPPISEMDRTEAISRYFLENLKQRIEEDPELRAAIEQLLKKKRGPKTKWGLLERAALISEVRSHIPRRSSESLTNETSITDICKALARQTHWSRFLENAENGGETLRQRYTEGSKDQSLIKLARLISGSEDAEDEKARADFILRILGEPDEQQSDQTLDQFMNRMARKTS
jgi:hypothetical protein